jgi:gamma-glutamyl hercynylcysteine S-oxide synthase
MSTGLEAMERARGATLRFVQGLSEQTLRRWPDPSFSPIGWHLGHVAFTEAQWVLDRLEGDESLCRPFARAFAQDGRPKHERDRLPERGELLGYMDRVRDRVRAVLPTPARAHALLRDGFLGWFLAAHEHQHRETMAFVLGQQRSLATADRGDTEGAPLADDEPPASVVIPGGRVRVGSDGPCAYDNEQPAHEVHVGTFLLDAHPVTSAAFARFMRAGGYAEPRWWSREGWHWRCAHDVRAPHGWVQVSPGRWARGRLGGIQPLDGREPVMGVSFHEAEAYARFRGARLPTEHEWEHAARMFGPGPRALLGLETDGPVPVLPGGRIPTDLLGQVWEWTASTFEPYPGFRPFPYRGYSTPYFGGTHRVLRGGSFATSPAIASPAFRNWYLPTIRPVFAGFRCAQDR